MTPKTTIQQQARQHWITGPDLKRIREGIPSSRDPQRSMTQLEFAILLDINPITLSRYERGVVEIPKVIALFAWFLETKKLSVQDIERETFVRKHGPRRA